MKNLIIILLLCLPALFVNAQVTDTTAYLKTIAADKEKYIGKTFKQLEKDLKIKIVYFSSMNKNYSDVSKETSTCFYFIVPEYVDDFGVNFIEIYWNPYLDANTSGKIFGDAPDDSNWTEAAKTFYRKGVIKDIKAR